MSQAVFFGVTPAQSELVMYWQSLRGPNGLVARCAINPGHVRKHLSEISLVEMGQDGHGRFRLAGSKLCQRYGANVSGQTLNDALGQSADIFALGVTAALERAEPIGGVMETRQGRHAWLRLPLCNRDGLLSLVLCHDSLLQAEDAELFAPSIPLYPSVRAA